MRVAITLGKLAGRTFVFPGTYDVTLGREQGCELTLADKGVSRRHCRLIPGTPPLVEDLGSRNGTFVNGERIEGARPVEPTDTITLGAARFQVSAADALSTDVAPPDTDSAVSASDAARRAVSREAPTVIETDTERTAPPGLRAATPGRETASGRKTTDAFKSQPLLEYTFCAKCGGTVDVSRPTDGVAYLCDDCRATLAEKTTEVGRYRALAQIGEGATARVYRAVDEENKLVALKVYFLQPGADDRKLQRVIREVHTTAKLDHPNIVGLREAGRAGNALYVALEYVEGTDLGEQVDRHGGLDPLQVVSVGKQVADALAYAHGASIVHRDLKPHNLLMATDGTVKVTDFGLAKVLDSATTGGLTYSGAMLGTAGYMPPEQVGSAKKADARSDVYGLGATLYHLLVGAPPYHGSAAEVLGGILSTAPVLPPIDLRPEIPPLLDLVLRRALEKEPRRRFDSAAEMGLVLGQVASVLGAD